MDREALGWPKMSEVLLDFAQPLLETLSPGRDVQGVEGCLLLAAAIWNELEQALDEARDEHAFLGEAARVCRQFSDTMVESGVRREEADELLMELAARKFRDYFDDERMIADVKVVEKPGGYSVTVVGTLHT